MKNKISKTKKLYSKKGMTLLQVVGVCIIALALVIIMSLSVMSIIGDSNEGAIEQMENSSQRINDITDLQGLEND